MSNPIIAESDTTTSYFVKCCNQKIPVSQEGSIFCSICNKHYKIGLLEEKKECHHRWFLEDDEELKTTIELKCDYCDKVARYIVHPDEIL